MVIYKANRYYTTMNYDTFLNLSTDIDVLNKANELFMEVINDNNEENVAAFDKYMEDNCMIYLDDVSSPMEIGIIQGTNNLYCAMKDGIAYIYEVVNDFTSRF